VKSSPERVELVAALDHLDEVFRGIKPPADPGGCDFCWPNGWDVLLGPVAEVSEDDLVSFAMEGPDHWDAYSTMLRRFFPRIARLLADGQLHVDAGWVLSHLTDAEWTTWDQEEQRAVGEYLDAIFRKILSEKPQGDLDGQEILGVVSAATGDVEPWLGVWDRLPGTAKWSHVPALVRMRPRVHSDADWLFPADGIRNDGRWPAGAAAAIKAWLLRPKIEEELFALLEDKDPFAEDALQELEQMRASEGDVYVRELRSRAGKTALQRIAGAFVRGYEGEIAPTPDGYTIWNDTARVKRHLALTAPVTAKQLSDIAALRNDLTVDDATAVISGILSPETHKHHRAALGESRKQYEEFVVESLVSSLLEQTEEEQASD